MNATRLARAVGPLRLAPGVTARQVAFYMLIVMIGGSLFIFFGVMQPYVLNEILHIDSALQGRLIGTLNSVQFGAVLLFLSVVGTVADVVGRRIVFVTAVVLLSGCLTLLPLVPSVGALVALRFLFGIASAALTVGGVTLMLEYPDPASRGRFISLMLFVQGALQGAISGWLLPRVPTWLHAAGYDLTTSTRLACGSAAAVGLVAAGFAQRLLREPRPLVRAARPSDRSVPGAAAASVAQAWRNLRQIVAASQANPRLGLVMLLGFAVRADSYVFGSFMALWVTTSARARGVEPATALKTVGLITATIFGTGVLLPPLLGMLADRIDRTRMLVGATLGTAIALCATRLIPDVLGPWMFVVVALVGTAEAAQSISAQAALADEAPPELLGSATGSYVMTGTFGVVVASALAGVLFDRLGPTAPFILLSALGFLCAGLGTLMLRRRPERFATRVAPLT